MKQLQFCHNKTKEWNRMRAVSTHTHVYNTQYSFSSVQQYYCLTNKIHHKSSSSSTNLNWALTHFYWPWSNNNIIEICVYMQSETKVSTHGKHLSAFSWRKKNEVKMCFLFQNHCCSLSNRKQLLKCQKILRFFWTNDWENEINTERWDEEKSIRNEMIIHFIQAHGKSLKLSDSSDFFFILI